VESPELQLRDCTEADLPGLVAIYNDVIATSTAVFFDKPVSLDDRRDWWRARVAQGYPVIVALDSQGVAGFGTFGDFRSFPGYRFTVEHSVHVRTDRRGSGIGQALVIELIGRAKALGKHCMIAGVDGDNAGSIRFHERLGFEQAARLRQVGRKFDRWLDLVFLQKIL
jgi:L-amino acid N-acyltransferase YncA